MACTIVGKSSAEGVHQDVRVSYEGIASLLTAGGVPSDPTLLQRPALNCRRCVGLACCATAFA
jgi:hypothetical protein